MYAIARTLRAGGGFTTSTAPLLMRYLRRLGLEEDRGERPRAGCLCTVAAVLPTFELDSKRGRFRSTSGSLTYSACGSRAWRVQARQAEEQWVKRFYESSEAESRKLQDELNEINQEQVLKRALPRVHSKTRAQHGHVLSRDCSVIGPARTFAAELRITVDAVYVYSSRVLKAVAERSALWLADELGDEPIDSAAASEMNL